MAYEPFPETFLQLAGAGLSLREFCEADLGAWLERLSDPEAAALADDPIATSMSTVVEGLAHHRAAFRERTGLRWAIVPEYGFGPLALEAIEAVVLPENTRTLRVLEKLGFEKHPRPCPPERRINGRTDSDLFLLAAAERSSPTRRCS